MASEVRTETRAAKVVTPTQIMRLQWLRDDETSYPNAVRNTLVVRVSVQRMFAIWAFYFRHPCLSTYLSSAWRPLISYGNARGPAPLFGIQVVPAIVTICVHSRALETAHMAIAQMGDAVGLTTETLCPHNTRATLCSAV